jgi:succinyl-diaminopimelate desuccinylase
MQQFDQLIDNMKEELIKTTQELIRFKSVKMPEEPHMPFGPGIDACLNHALETANAIGFETRNVDHYAGYAEMGQGSDMVGILVHLDVVPEGDGWTHDPYSGDIADGRIYGRGINDNKGPAAAALYAMKAVRDSGLPLSKRVRLIFGTDEESGWGCMDYYKQHEEAPTIAFSPDADFPAIHGEMGILVFDLVKTFKERLSDGGIRLVSLRGGNRPNMVPDYAEAVLENYKPSEDLLNAWNTDTGAHVTLEAGADGTTATVKAYGTSAHGSTPWKGRNAISDLLGFLDCLDLEIGDVTNFVRFYAAQIGSDLHGERMGCAFEDEASGKLVFNVGIAELDANSGSGSLTINIRYPITADGDAVLQGVREAAGLWGFELANLEHQKPLYVPKDHPLVATLMKVYQTYTGDETGAVTIGGGTYARAFENAVAFGPMFPGMEETAHQKDEFYGVEDLVLITKIYAAAIYELAR